MESVKKLTRREKIAQNIEKPKGNRKKRSAEARKEQKKQKSFAVLNDYPSSPRKMRLVVDQIRGVNVGHAMNVLHLSPKAASKPLRKLLRSALDNWEKKNPEVRTDTANLVVKAAFVNPGKVMKRIRPAPQGRAYRVRKRSNHVTIIVDKTE